MLEYHPLLLYRDCMSALIDIRKGRNIREIFINPLENFLKSCEKGRDYHGKLYAGQYIDMKNYEDFSKVTEKSGAIHRLEDYSFYLNNLKKGDEKSVIVLKEFFEELGKHQRQKEMVNRDSRIEGFKFAA